MMSNSAIVSEESIDSLNNVLTLFPKTAHINIHSCYNIQVPSSWGFTDRINQDYHIIFIKEGHGHYIVEDTDVPFDDGRIFLLSPGIKHTAIQDSKNSPFDLPRIIPVRFGVYSHDSFKSQNCLSKPFCISFIPGNSTEYKMLFEKLYAYHSAFNSEFSSFASGFVLYEILYLIYMELSSKINSSSTFNSNSIDNRILKAKEHIDSHQMSDFSTRQLADISGLSERYFRNIFKMQYSLSPKQYQLKVRMELAKLMLEESNRNIKQIAYELGYPDQYTFSKQFKKVMGYPPKTLNGHKGTVLLC